MRMSISFEKLQTANVVNKNHPVKNASQVFSLS
jgi:hypothetical protein